MRGPALCLVLVVAVASLALAQSTPIARPSAVIVIDPGHGGEDVGVRGEGGITEKDVTLQLAQRLATAVAAVPGLRGVLTRDGDRQVSPDDRAATANRAHGSVFVSLHVNSHPSSDATGSMIYLAPAPAAPAPVARLGRTPPPPPFSVPMPGGGTREVPLTPWTTVQRAHVDASMRLAQLVAQHLRDVTAPASPIARAPLRVLAGADMPALLIEVGYLTSPDFATQISTESFQITLGQTLASAVADFVAGVEPDSPQAR